MSTITWEYIDNYINNKIGLYEYIILDWLNIINKNYWNVATLRIIMDKPYEERMNNLLKIDYDYKLDFNDQEIINYIIEKLKEHQK